MITKSEAARLWLRIGLLNFGGPAAQIALIHREVVETRRWISEERFTRALNYCMLLPGPEAQQLATYIGWLLHGTRGGLVAGLLFIIPGAIVMFLLSALYAYYNEIPSVAALFFGLKAAVIAIVLEAVIRIGKRNLRSRPMQAVAAAAFIVIFIFHVPFPIVIAGAGLAGIYISAPRTSAASHTTGGEVGAHHPNTPSVIDALDAAQLLPHTQPSKYHIPRVLLSGLAIWIVPPAAIALALGADSVFTEISVFLSKSAFVTFGGAYAVLTYVSDAAVNQYHWLSTAGMLDGLGLAETTPGPLILVLQFVGFQAGYSRAGVLPPMAGGALGSALALWCTFAPSFLFIFLGAPYVEILQKQQFLKNALAAISAAVVGVILNLSVQFTLHTWFADVGEWSAGPVRLPAPAASTIQWAAIALSAVSAICIFRLKAGIPLTLAICATLGIACRLFIK